MQAKSDAQLLREYAVEKSETAFGDVVRRYADLVYSAALRQAGSPDAAGEIAQSVFIDLARKARSLAGRLREDGSLAGWLHCATRYAALNLLREERRRHARERKVMLELHAASESSPDWDSVAPLLDEALSALDEPERDALLLRFFKNQDFRAVGAALGVSDDTAQKRVARSLEKLRVLLQRRGVTTTTAALSAALAAHAVEAAPAALTAAWITASLASATAQGGAAMTLIKLMSMTKVQLGLGAIAVGALAVTVAIQHQTVNKTRGENEALRQQVASLAANHESPANPPQRVAAPAALPDDQLRELLRLRGEVGRLRDQTNQVGKLQEENRHLQAGVKTTQEQMAEAEKFAQHNLSIVNAAKMIGLAMRIYANNYSNQFPTNFADMHDELGNQTNFPGDIPLNSFEMVNVGKANDRYPQSAAAREITPRPSPLGGWERVYVLSDGSVRQAGSPSQNFEAWEQSNFANAFPP